MKSIFSHLRQKGESESHDFFFTLLYIIRGCYTLISGLFCAASSSVEPPSHGAPGFMVPRSPLFSRHLKYEHEDEISTIFTSQVQILKKLGHFLGKDIASKCSSTEEQVFWVNR